MAVDPRNTSRRCPACGHTGKKNRPTQEKAEVVSVGREPVSAKWLLSPPCRPAPPVSGRRRVNRAGPSASTPTASPTGARTLYAVSAGGREALLRCRAKPSVGSEAPSRSLRPRQAGPS
ncbi:hypothetical protein [Streptomyces sp. NPDC052107]|uniref:hypothetical protein n=1 Tax=Streptomyces sp. NPDC052107 TaxID=3155632 RepID=UPI0034147ADC